MQTNRELIRRIRASKFVDRRRQADGADCDSAWADSKTEVGVFRNREGFEHALKIRERFTHTHHHDMAQSFFGFKQSLKFEHLLKDFPAS